jgi:polar amino acid transport system substrate-binding protein
MGKIHTRWNIGAALGAVLLVIAPRAIGAEVAPPSNMVSPGKLTYGVTAAFKPFEYMADGKLVGFDVDMAALLAKKMDLEPAPLTMAFDGLLPALQGRRIDIINSGMYINEKRKEQADLIPYVRIGQDIVVRKGNPAKISGREDICGKRVGVSAGTIQEIQANQDVARCAAAGKPKVEVFTFPHGGSTLALMQGRVDAYYFGTPAAVVLIEEYPNDFEKAGETFEANTLIGIGVAKDRQDLKSSIEQALSAIRKDGSFAALLKKHGLPEASAAVD